MCFFMTPGTTTTEFCWSHCFHNHSQSVTDIKKGNKGHAKYKRKYLDREEKERKTDGGPTTWREERKTFK